MMKIRVLLISLLSALVFNNLTATVHNVTVASFSFTPNSLSINQGDTVVWTNTGGFHNVNGTTFTFPGNPASFGSGGASGPGWTFQFVFTVPGNYSYRCDPHSGSMQGTVTVAAAPPAASDMIISAVYDGPLSGGTPKGVELYVINNIPDLSQYGIGSANNGGGSDGQEFTFPAVSATAGSFIYIATTSADFNAFFGFMPDYTDGSMAINGDDAIELFSNGTVIDVFGDINVDGSGQPWEYLDSWAYRVNGTGPDDSTFVLANWTFGGPNVLDGDTLNSTAGTPVPIGTYSMGGPSGPVPGYPAATIASVTTNDPSFVPDSLNQSFELNGTIFSIDFDGNAGYSFYMYDNTGGINVFNFSDKNGYTSPLQGDSVTVYGDIDQFRGLTQFFVDSIVLRSSGNVLKTPATVTTLNESTEGEYIRVDSVQLLTPSQWPSSGSSANVDIYNSTDTMTMRIDSDTDIDGTLAPVGLFAVRGAGGQFTLDSIPNNGYQILPSSLADIALLPPANPTINFELTSQSAIESAGTITVNLLVAPTAGVSTSVDIEFALGSNVTIPGDGSISPLPNITTGLLTLTIPANEDTVSFDINIVDDAMIEGNETLFYSINAVSAGMLQGALDSAFLVVIDNDAVAPGIPTYNINQVTGVDANGVADSLTVEFKANAVVYTDDFDGNNGYSFYVYDNTGGINVFNFNDVPSGYQVSRGDSLRLIGKIAQFNGLTELEVDSIVVLDSNIVLKNPTVVTTLDETTEGEYIRMNGMTLVTPSQWPTSAGSSANVDITDGTNTFTMRIDSDTEIDGTPAPTGAFDVIGAGGQFDNSSPFTSGYQIFPRDTNDIIPVVATTPTVAFPANSQSQLEDAGTVTITLPIGPAVPPPATTIKIFVNNGAGITSGDYSTSPAAIGDTIFLSAAGGANSVSFDVVITDDLLQESSEDITFSIADAGSLSIGIPSTHIFTIQDNDTPIPTYKISEIVGTDTVTGIADSLGLYVRLVGIVTSPALQSSNLDFFFTDASNDAGLKVFAFGSNFPYNPIMGDELRVVGTLQQFRGQLQIVPDSVTVVSSGNTVSPDLVTTPSEMTEGRVIRLNGVELIDTANWPSGSNGNFRIFLANGDTTTLRLDGDIITTWGPLPIGKFDVVGNGGQFATNSSGPFTDGYQIGPREGSEIIRNLPKLAITEVLSGSVHPTPVDGDWFELTNYGNTDIDLNGFSWDDDDAQPGTHQITASYVIKAGESVIFLEALSSVIPAWETSWKLQAGATKIIAEDNFGSLGFSGLSSSGDEVNFYDANGVLLSKAAWSATDVSPGFSLEYDLASTLTGKAVSGINGAYLSNDGDVGSPGKRTISLGEFTYSNVKLYPNPAVDFIILEMDTKGTKHIAISDVSGKTIKTITFDESRVELPTADIAPGLYFITVENNGQRATRQIIKR